jgi:hypothetical protein
VKRAVWLIAQVIWLILCLVVLIEAYRGYRGNSDWQVEEALGFEMMLLSFPASALVVLAFIATGMVLGLFGLALPASSRPEMIATWLLFALAGSFQWFVFVPAIPRSWKKFKVNE